MNKMPLVCLLIGFALVACDDDDISNPQDSGVSDAGDVTVDAVGDGGEGDAQADADASQVPDPSTYAECAPYAVAGPNAVGVTTVEIDGAPVEIWYPAAEAPSDDQSPVTYDLRDWLPDDERDKIPEDAPTTYTTDAYRDLAIADGEHPVVLFSHGFAGYRMQSTEYTTHLASWGFVVASPEHPERGLEAVLNNNINFTGTEDIGALVGTLDWLEGADAEADGFFEGHLKLDEVGATGHSAGGRAALATAAQDERIVSVVGLAPALGVGGEDPTGVDARQVHIAGGDDGLVSPGGIRSFWDDQPAPKLYLSIAGAGHLAFSDICLIGQEAGGILQIAQDNGVSVNPVVVGLASDGCRDDQLAPQASWPVFHHFATAELRFALGLDGEPTSLDEAASQCFGDLVEDYAD
ncbi:hypothetical protein FIV42_16915 [Persicimonas caeni]|uniref:Alpha/beta hydrolase n=1 Tax=Persicimonas caeni TaxID=2292766 RepID=A0A4Y6PVT8_PERCE|nr:hypothetical protein [Persicimonas caeni]QDG52360.1 hypothetical protein FIV42_16915 [Persicimonas caeni]QED33582.1 hypothetical protein FRD00_16910 [Persicimonas caeni]